MIISVWISVFIASVFVPFIISIMIKNSTKHDLKILDSKNYTIAMPKGFVWFFGIMGIILLVLTVIANIILTYEQSLAIFNAFMLIGAIISIIGLLLCRRKIIVDNDNIKYISAFGKNYDITFKDISKIVLQKNYNQPRTYAAYVGDKKLFVFSRSQKNALIFLRHALELGINIIE